MTAQTPNYRETTLENEVRLADPNQPQANARTAVYEFDGGRVKFYGKRNPYDDSEPMRGSQGGSTPRDDGFLLS